MKDNDLSVDDLQAVATASRGIGQPHSLFAALDSALNNSIGHILFTVLLLHESSNENERFYTNNAKDYPVGGRKKVVPSDWTEQLYVRQLPFIGTTADDIRRVFFDHEIIISLGCESVLNIPVVYDGRTLGSMNLLHEANWYTEHHVEAAQVFAALAIPGYLRLLDSALA
ncbi:MAG: GAF domain-containing protein [Gammaproteobacteria bacterium]|nr:GAF domain-containing protein [Gammaproteobacteria bacterium]